MKLLAAICTSLILMGCASSAQNVPEEEPEGSVAFQGVLHMICNKADFVEQYYIDNNQKKSPMGVGVRGFTYEMWIGRYKGKHIWTFMFHDTKNGVRCQIDNGIINVTPHVIPEKPESEKKPTIEDFKKKSGFEA